MTQTLASICSNLKHPCKVYEMLEACYIERGLGNVAISINIEGHATTLSLPSLDNLRKMRDEYAAKCRAAGGCIPGAAPRSFCLEFGDRACTKCPPRCCTC